MASTLSTIHSKWHYNFDDFKFSPLEFYGQVEEHVKKREIPGLSISRVSFAETGLLSSRREYLRISRKNSAFDICAAPFGNCFFVSWWLGEKQGFIAELISKIPYVGPFLASNSKPKTYYQLDTISMFKESVRSAVNEAIEEMVKAKGVRGLSELDMKPIDSAK